MSYGSVLQLNIVLLGTRAWCMRHPCAVPYTRFVGSHPMLKTGEQRTRWKRKTKKYDQLRRKQLTLLPERTRKRTLFLMKLPTNRNTTCLW